MTRITIHKLPSALGDVGIIARLKPLHNAHAVLLELLCRQAKHVYIGLGSCNRYNAQNPFTAKESADMVNLVLKPKHANYSFIEVPDFDNGHVWREQVKKLFGKLDCFITGNDYVEQLLKKDYNIFHPHTILPPENRIALNATIVRTAIACGKPWERLVPKKVAEYIKQNKLDKRFVGEFGHHYANIAAAYAMKGCSSASFTADFSSPSLLPATL
ncbi:MAG: hypothetical protein HY363_04030 [Candidatus Aenigmarchaeota archaeon]|nr:hypothetical protein [Candidatus Aenigmarchaeota archaeon]